MQKAILLIDFLGLRLKGKQVYTYGSHMHVSICKISALCRVGHIEYSAIVLPESKMIAVHSILQNIWKFLSAADSAQKSIIDAFDSMGYLTMPLMSYLSSFSAALYQGV